MSNAILRGGLRPRGSNLKIVPFAWPLAAETFPQKIGEQIVVAEGGLALVRCDDVEIAAIQIFQDAAGIGASRQSVANFRTEAREDGSLQKKVAQIIRLAVQNLFGEEIEN